MARTAQKVESLVSEDPSLAEALVVILEQTDGGTGEVEWGDVRDSLSTGQWGRLIETGVLVDGTDGFTVDDPETVIEVVGYDAEEGADDIDTAVAEVDDDEDSGWTTWDKAAAIGSIGLFAGYSVGQVRNLIGGTLDLVLGPFDALLPFYAVILVMAIMTGLWSTILQANLMDMEKMGQYQERMQSIQERQKKAKEQGDDEKVQEIREEQMEAMGDQLGMFKLQFRPMVWIMLFTIPVFLWMYWKILPQGNGVIVGPETTMVFPFVGELQNGWTSGIAGPIQAWIVWYFVCSMAFTQIIRKALDIQTTPT